jgi:hypothetical protein
MANNDYKLSKEDADRKAEEKREAIGIVFENINTGEVRVATTVEHIAAFFNSSDEGPNAKNKQDMGWRLSPEDLIELEELKNDVAVMERIGSVYQIPAEDVTDYNVLKYMASKRFASAKQAATADGKDYESDYERRVREAREGKKAPVKTEPTEEEKAEAEAKKAEEKAKKEAEKKAKADAAAAKNNTPPAN